MKMHQMEMHQMEMRQMEYVEPDSYHNFDIWRVYRSNFIYNREQGPSQ